MLFQALCIISSSFVNSNWSYGPETVKLGCDLCDLHLWPWPFAWASLLSLIIISWWYDDGNIVKNVTGDPLHSRAACTQPCNVNTHSRAHCSPWARLCEQWMHGCVNNGARLCASARLCRGSPVNVSQTDRRTEVRTDRRTEPFIELPGRS